MLFELPFVRFPVGDIPTHADDPADLVVLVVEGEFVVDEDVLAPVDVANAFPRLGGLRLDDVPIVGPDRRRALGVEQLLVGLAYHRLGRQPERGGTDVVDEAVPPVEGLDVNRFGRVVDDRVEPALRACELFLSTFPLVDLP